MAKVIVNLVETEIHGMAHQAHREGNAVSLDPPTVMQLSYGYFRFQEIREALSLLPVSMRRRLGVVKESTVVSWLVGVHDAFMQAGEHRGIPKQLFDVVRTNLNEWQTWASLISDRMVSDEDMRTNIQQKLEDAAEARRWLEWAQGHLTEELQHGALWDGTHANLRDHLSPKISGSLAAGRHVDTDWCTWAQGALGLSDAYMKEQNLDVGDLRRMIRERL